MKQCYMCEIICANIQLWQYKEQYGNKISLCLFELNLHNKELIYYASNSKTIH